MENMEGSGQPSVLVNLFRGFKVESLGLTSTLVADVSRRSSLSSYLCNISKGISNLAPSIMMSVAMSSDLTCICQSSAFELLAELGAQKHFRSFSTTVPPELRACCWRTWGHMGSRYHQPKYCTIFGQHIAETC